MSALPNIYASFKPLSQNPGTELSKLQNEQRPKLAAALSARTPVPVRSATPRSATLFALSKESEDARITGGTRSLDRRLLALNLSKSPAS